MGLRFTHQKVQGHHSSIRGPEHLQPFIIPNIPLQVLDEPPAEPHWLYVILFFIFYPLLSSSSSLIPDSVCPSCFTIAAKRLVAFQKKASTCVGADIQSAATFKVNSAGKGTASAPFLRHQPCQGEYKLPARRQSDECLRCTGQQSERSPSASTTSWSLSDTCGINVRGCSRHRLHAAEDKGF